MQVKNNGHLYEQLRKQYPVFVFESYTYKIIDGDIHVRFKYTAGSDIVMEPCTIIKNHEEYRHFFSDHSLQDLDTLFFQLGMAELISYWKAVCSPTVKILVGSLDADAVDFWKKLYFNGLGEFFYINGINATEADFMQIESPSAQMMPKVDVNLLSKTIVPIGGGKDSVVTLEALRQQEDIIPLIINPRGATLECAQKAGFEGNFFEINRTISPALLDLNAKGYLNGHTPFSAMLAFYTLLVSCLSGRKNIALSNESSANEPTVRGMNGKHQYSKSIEFEADFREYVAQYLTEDVSYYSFLRPLSELQIACLFAEQPAYFPVFRSCNVGSKQDIWCGHCPKCLFTCIMLSAFLPAEKVREIFGKDLLEDETLWPVLKELCGETAVKPFECVGTREEVCMALCEIIRQYESRNKSLPTLLASFRRTALYESYRQRDFQPLLTAWDPQHFLPEDEEQLLRKALEI